MTETQKILERLDQIGARPSSQHPIIDGENIAEVFEQIDEEIEELKGIVRFIIKEIWKPQ